MVEKSSPGYPHNTHTGIMFFLSHMSVMSRMVIRSGHTCSLNSLQRKLGVFSNIHLKQPTGQAYEVTTWHCWDTKSSINSN